VGIKAAKQGEVWWVNLDPTVGKEISKKRPCLVVSPDEMNGQLGTVVVAPVTSTVRPWPTRLSVSLQRKTSSVALDQIRMIDNARLVSRLTTIDPEPALAILREMFASTSS
jgi:mRNA interferase MazF